MSARAARPDGLNAAYLRFLDVDGVRTRVWEAGAGEPLVLVHGGHFGTLYALDAWSLNLESLAQSFRVLAFDRLGQGHTDNPASEADYTFTASLAHARRTLDALNVEGAHLVGHSRGGLLVARLAMLHPDRVRSVTVADSATLAPDLPGHDPDAFYQTLFAQRPPGPPTRDFVRLEPEAQSFSNAHVSEDFVARLQEIAQLPKTGLAAERLRALNDKVWSPDLGAHRAAAWSVLNGPGLRQPVLVLWGAADPSAPVEMALPLYKMLNRGTARAELHVCARAGHYAFRERPQAFERVLAYFLSEVAGGGL